MLVSECSLNAQQEDGFLSCCYSSYQTLLVCSELSLFSTWCSWDLSKDDGVWVWFFFGI